MTLPAGARVPRWVTWAERWLLGVIALPVGRTLQAAEGRL